MSSQDSPLPDSRKRRREEASVKPKNSFVLDEPEMTPEKLLDKLGSIGVEQSALITLQHICHSTSPDARWRTVAELGLLVASARYHGKPLDFKKLQEQLEEVRNLEHNQMRLQDAVNQGNFNLASFVPTSEKSIKELIIKEGKELGSVKVVQLNGSDNDVVDRHVKLAIDETLLFPQKEINDAVRSTPCQQQLAIVTGPSGSGKTACMIAAQVENKLGCLYWYPPSALEDELKGLNAEKRDEAVVATLKNAIAARLGRVTKRCAGTVLLVLDELGAHPTTLRALCSFYKKDANDKPLNNHLRELYGALLCDNVVLIAGGTGCDLAESSIGSMPQAYVVIRMNDARGREFLDTYLEKDKHISSALRSMIQGNGQSWSSPCIHQALLNRRIAVLFFNMACEAQWSCCDWYQNAPLVLQQATMQYKLKNRLGSYDFAALTRLFAKALAVTMGGPDQSLPLNESRELAVETGLIEDYARVTRGGNDSVKVDTSGLSHRYGMSAALVQLILNFLGGVAARSRSGDGFEQTIADFALVQLLAGTTQIKIADVEHDPLHHLKVALREMARGAAFVVSVQLCATATTVVQALLLVKAQLEQRFNDDGTVRSPGKFVAVARNYDKTQGADLFVVRGKLRKDSQSGKNWVVSTKDSALLLQCKHYTATTLMKYTATAEFYKMGSRTLEDCAGHVAEKIDLADLASEEKFTAFQQERKIFGRVVFPSLPKDMARMDATRKSVPRKQLYERLVAQAVNLPVGLDASQYFLVALVGEEPRWTDSRVLWLVQPDCDETNIDDPSKPSRIASALAPIRLRPMQCKEARANCGFLEDVKVVETRTASLERKV